MTIEFMLNEKSIKTSIVSADRALNVLVEQCDIESLLGAYQANSLGASIVLYEKRPAYSALLPAFLLRNRNITTLEYFEGSKVYAVLWKEFR